MDEEYIDDVRDNVDAILISDAIQSILLSALTERQRQVINHRFWDGFTLAETAKKLRVSQERIRQIEAGALRVLRHYSRLPLWKKIIPEYSERRTTAEKIRSAKIDIYFEKKRRENEERREEYELELKKRKERQRAMHVTCMETLGFPRIPEPLKERPQEVKRKASFRCPSMVILKFFPGGHAYLSTAYPHNYSANISRDRDPETYDRWLDQRLKEHSA